MVRSHIRAMHGIEVAPGNARMGRPRRGATATVGAIETERRNERRRLGRLISQYVRNRVAARFVRDRLQVVMTSGLSTASIAATVVEALEPVCAYYPGFNSEIASAKASLLQCNHAQFNSKIQLSKHISDHHRSVTSIVVNGVSYPLAAREASGKYLCPKCDREIASMSTLRRHMAQNVNVLRARARAQVQQTRPAAPEACADAIPAQETMATALNLEEPRTLDDFGFTYEYT
ncbi:hypothetical protein V1505DRAFT_29455 [Lipomyces doorenjongii]